MIGKSIYKSGARARFGTWKPSPPPGFRFATRFFRQAFPCVLQGIGFCLEKATQNRSKSYPKWLQKSGLFCMSIFSCFGMLFGLSKSYPWRLQIYSKFSSAALFVFVSQMCSTLLKVCLHVGSWKTCKTSFFVDFYSVFVDFALCGRCQLCYTRPPKLFAFCF